MRCPRCDGTLQTFVLEGTEGKAVVCRSCGFAGVPAAHRHDGEPVESWEQVLARFDEAVLPPAPTERTEGTGDVPTADESDAAIDPDRLEETVPVETTLADGTDEDRTDE